MKRLRPVLALVLLLAAACGGGARRPRELRPVSELPEDLRAVLVAYGRGGPAWEELRGEVLGDPRRARFLAENLVLEMVRAFDQARLARPGEQRGPFERARDELVLLGDHSIPVLVELLGARDGVVPMLCGRVLVEIGPGSVGPVAGMLDDAEGRVRRIVAELLGELPHGGGIEDDVQRRLAALVAGDPEWVVRAQAARSLGIRGARHRTTSIALEALSPALADEERVVGREAAVALAVLADPRAVPALIGFLERSIRRVDPRGARAAEEALGALTGADGIEGARGWRDFWRDHRREVLGSAAGGPY